MSLLRPTALPDELASGYDGRVLRYNGWTDRKLAMGWLLNWSGGVGASRREVPTVELLANVAGLETAQFVQDHTTLPMRRAVTSLMPGLPHGCASNASVLWTMAMRATRPGAYFCGRCVEEDLDFHGAPYWRRGCQLPGVFWCPKHGNPLSFVESTSAFAASPTDFIDSGHVVSERWVETLKACAPIARFQAICADLLARTTSLDERAVSKALRRRALQFDLHVGRGAVRQRLLSDLIKRRFNPKWLDSVLPGLAEKPRGEYWQTVDGALLGKRAGVSSLVYALAGAALYDTSDDAVNAMVAARSAEAMNEAAPKSESLVSDDELRVAFVEARGSHAASAAKLNLRRDEATRRLTRLGLPSLWRVDGHKLKAVMSALLEGNLSLEKACQRHGVSSHAAVLALRQAMAPLDTALEKMTSKRIRRTLGPRRTPHSPPRQPPRAPASTAAVERIAVARVS